MTAPMEGQEIQDRTTVLSKVHWYNGLDLMGALSGQCLKQQNKKNYLEDYKKGGEKEG